jgi:hypothetical protein
MLFLRAYERVSFVEAVERTKFDPRWKVALGLEMEEVPMQKSTLQEFEAKLVLHQKGGQRPSDTRSPRVCLPCAGVHHAPEPTSNYPSSAGMLSPPLADRTDLQALEIDCPVGPRPEAG